MSEPESVAGHFRVSHARDDMRAPELYRDQIERYCAYKGLVLAETFSDIDYSAFRGAKSRPAPEELKARRFEFSGVVVPKLARFGRSVRDLVALFDLFDRDGITLTFLDMNIDTSTSQGRLLRRILAAFTEYESDVKSD
jgi:site-specific DNA recombinase